MFDDGENIHQRVEEFEDVFLIFAVSLSGVAENWNDKRGEIIVSKFLNILFQASNLILEQSGK